MVVVFRVDASFEIGAGHVMRCLTIADELTRQGHNCYFICREHLGHLGELILCRGFSLRLLPDQQDLESLRNKHLYDEYAQWLGVPWQVDAYQTLDIVTEYRPDWLIVDHYALDARWENILLNASSKIMVIDDLANRSHDCTLLLDQTFGRNADEYKSLVPEKCTLLCGSRYALLRPEFSELRDKSIKRRVKPELQQILITMGGVDKDNFTGRVLDALYSSDLPNNCKIIVVMGATAPWLEEVKLQANKLPWCTEVRVGVNNMAEIMSNSDLAIGASGSTTWERCCLGLPSILITIAQNQQTIAENLEKANAAVCLTGSFEKNHLLDALKNLNLKILSQNSSTICSGMGVKLVVQEMVMI